MRSHKTFHHILILALFFALLLVMCLSVALGAVSIPFSTEMKIIWNSLSFFSQAHCPTHYKVIVMEIRLPRVLLGAFVGFILSLCGGVMQGVFRNPLAEPYLLGIASGATAGATLVFALRISHPSMSVPLGAFLGGSLAVLLVYMLAKPYSGWYSNYTLILAGVATAALFSSITNFFLFFSHKNQLRQVVFWMLGSMTGANWTQLKVLGIVLIVGSAFIFLFARELNALALGEEVALHLGVSTQIFKPILLGITTLLTACVVSMVGTIGFVGLIVPHATRLLVGPDHRVLLPACALVGAIFMIVCDTIARLLIPPIELPVGIITALLGAPFFLYLLKTQGKKLK